MDGGRIPTQECRLPVQQVVTSASELGDRFEPIVRKRKRRRTREPLEAGLLAQRHRQTIVDRRNDQPLQGAQAVGRPAQWREGHGGDRKGDAKGKRVDYGGWRYIKKKKEY